MSKWDVYTPNQVHSVLKEIGVDVAGEAMDNILVFCPYHNNRNTPAGEVTRESGRFYCFSCKTTATLDELVSHMTGKSYFEALRLIEGHKGSRDLVNDIDSILTKVEEPLPFDNELIVRLHENIWESPRAQQYYANRGITRESVANYKLGYSSNQDMVIFPVPHASGKFYIGFQARSVEGKAFKNSPNLQKSKTLFGIDQCVWEKEVFLTESPIDSILLRQQGVAAVSSMGANPSDAQIELLNRYFTRVFIMADNDDAGLGSAAKLKQKLRGRGIMVRPPTGYKDVGDMPSNEIHTLVNNIQNPVLGV